VIITQRLAIDNGFSCHGARDVRCLRLWL
jgi:hypothetical protein